MNQHPVSPQWSWLLLGITAVLAFVCRFVVSLGGGAVKGGAGRRRLRRAVVGAQQHLVLGGALRAAGLLLHQELLKPVGGEGEGLTLELHQVGVLQPRLGEAVSGRWAGPANSNNQVSAAQTAPNHGGGGASPRVTAQHLLAESGGALGHVWEKFAGVKLCNQDFGLDLSRIFILKGQSAAEPGQR